MKKFSKGQFVYYRTVFGVDVKAIVRVVHRDGSVTVEARHAIKNGKREGGYIGHRYRYVGSLLRAA